MIVTCKPFDEMTLPELRREFLQWVEATRLGGWAAHYGNAHICRETLATWIARREREAQEIAA